MTGAMGYHPGGAAHSRRMLELSGLEPPARILDMGAGAGETVAMLRREGFDVVGIDLEPRSEAVEQGDFLAPAFATGSFDGIISQCSFFISGNQRLAMRQAAKLLKKGGILMLSDVCPAAEPLSELAGAAGFLCLHREDMTALWRQFYIQAIWDSEDGCIPCFPKGKKYIYEMVICRKEG